jgi:hypothetical protein
MQLLKSLKTLLSLKRSWSLKLKVQEIFCFGFHFNCFFLVHLVIFGRELLQWPDWSLLQQLLYYQFQSWQLGLSYYFDEAIDGNPDSIPDLLV